MKEIKEKKAEDKKASILQSLESDSPSIFFHCGIKKALPGWTRGRKWESATGTDGDTG